MMLYLAAFALAAAALALLGYLSRLLWGAASLPLSHALEERRMRLHTERIARGDELLREGRLSPALAAFEQALYPHLGSSVAVASSVQRHHTGLLSRFIAAADRVQGERVRLISLAKVDRLFHQRRGLQDQYLAVFQGSGRQRRRAVESEFVQNTESLREALHALSAEVEAAQRVRYH